MSGGLSDLLLLAGEVTGGVAAHQTGDAGRAGGDQQAGHLTLHLTLTRGRHVLQAGVARHLSEDTKISSLTSQRNDNHISQI